VIIAEGNDFALEHNDSCHIPEHLVSPLVFT